METDPLAKSKWTFSAILATVIVLSVNIAAGVAMLMGKITWQDWASTIGPVNGIVLGWVGKEMTSQ